MCQQSNTVMLRFMSLIKGEPFADEDWPLLKEKSVMLAEEAIRRRCYELAVMLELNAEHVSNAQYTAERYADLLSLEAKVRLFHAFRKCNDDVARVLQHRWKLSKHLPKRYHR